jgi:phenylalanyl-tRNA synthetase beta chain
MLCFEGITMQLNVFRGKRPMPHFKLLDIPESKMQTITVAKDTAKVRPLVAGAILRNIKFTQATYDSFINLQDRLHQNLARQRTLVSLVFGGTRTAAELTSARSRSALTT